MGECVGEEAAELNPKGSSQASWKGSPRPGRLATPPPGACVQDSRAAVGDELLQLGQVNLALHGLGLRQCTHMQRDDVFSQQLGGRGDPGSAHRPSRARSQHRAGAGGEGELPGLEPVERRWPFFPWGLSAGKTTSGAARPSLPP